MYCGIASSLSEGECALQSQSRAEYFMSLANVVCVIWTINQTLTACVGKQSVKWRRAWGAPSKWHRGEKTNERNVYSTGKNLLICTLNVWKIFMIWVETGVGGGVKSTFPVALWSLIYAGHLITPQFRNLSERSCLLLKKPNPKNLPQNNNKKRNPVLNLENSAHLPMLMSLWCVSRCLLREGGSVFSLFMYSICWLQFWQSV